MVTRDTSDPVPTAFSILVLHCFQMDSHTIESVYMHRPFSAWYVLALEKSEHLYLQQTVIQNELETATDKVTVIRVSWNLQDSKSKCPGTYRTVSPSVLEPTGQ